MNRYSDIRNRQQEEFNKFPMMYAFTQKQFEDGMRSLGLEPNDTDKIYKTDGGGFYRKEDSPKLKEMIDRFDKELQAAIAEDKTGDGFIFEMFYSELADHEFGYSGDYSDTLESLGYSMEQIKADERLKHGFNKAVGKFR